MVFNIEIFNSTKAILLLLGIAICLLVGMAAGAIFCCYWNSFGKKKNETTPAVSCFMGLSVVPPLGEREEATGEGEGECECECECECEIKGEGESEGKKSTHTNLPECDLGVS